MTNSVLFYNFCQLMLEARVVLRFLGREMKREQRTLLQSMAAILAVESGSPNQRQYRVELQPILQTQGAIATLLASQLIIAAFAAL
jgi:hypothetical protein